MNDQREYNFKELDESKNPQWKANTFTFMYHVPIEILSKIKSMDDMKLLFLLAQNMSYYGEINIGTTWRKHAKVILKSDRHRVYRSIKSLDSLGFISRCGDYCKVNPLIFSKGTHSYRKAKGIVTAMSKP